MNPEAPQSPLLSDSATPQQLQALAYSNPELHPAIAAHPNAYPDLLQWLAQSQTPGTQEVLGQRAAGQLPWQQQSTTSPSTKHKNPALLASIAVLIVVVVFAVGVFAYIGTHSPRNSPSTPATTADDSSTTGSDTENEDNPGAESSSEKPTLEMTEDMLAQQPVELPQGCVEFTKFNNIPLTRQAVTNPSTYASVHLKEAQAVTNSDEPMLMAIINCFGGGAYSSDVVGFYDASLKLVASYDPVDDKTLGGYIPEAWLTIVSADQQKPVLKLSNIGVYGEDYFHAGRHETTAQITLKLDGASYHNIDTVYTLTSGKSVRVPSPNDVQTLVSAGKVPNLPSGSQVKVCTLVQPHVSSRTKVSNYVDKTSINTTKIGVLEPGDCICGVGDPIFDGTFGEYPHSIVLAGTADGTAVVKASE